MDVNKYSKNKQASKDKNLNNYTKMLSSFLPKDVLEEVDINNSSKTNSLSLNILSDKSTNKSRKSKINNNNNGNSNNSDKTKIINSCKIT